MPLVATKTVRDDLDAAVTISTGSVRVMAVIVANEQAVTNQITVNLTNVANDHIYETIVCDGADTENGFNCPWIADRGGLVARPVTGPSASAFVSVAFSADGA